MHKPPNRVEAIEGGLPTHPRRSSPGRALGVAPGPGRIARESSLGPVVDADAARPAGDADPRPDDRGRSSGRTSRHPCSTASEVVPDAAALERRVPAGEVLDRRRRSADGSRGDPDALARRGGARPGAGRVAGVADRLFDETAAGCGSAGGAGRLRGARVRNPPLLDGYADRLGELGRGSDDGPASRARSRSRPPPRRPRAGPRSGVRRGGHPEPDDRRRTTYDVLPDEARSR